jgi:hypothetical protein
MVKHGKFRCKKKITECNLKNWLVAQEIGVSEFTFSRWLRYEISPEKKTLIMKAIEKLSKE